MIHIYFKYIFLMIQYLPMSILYENSSTAPPTPPPHQLFTVFESISSQIPWWLREHQQKYAA